jgi:DMSO reductase anchor subunit
MKRGRNQNVSKPQQNANALRNNSFKNFNSSLLSNNYQLAAATLAAANTQFLQQVVVSYLRDSRENFGV